MPRLCQHSNLTSQRKKQREAAAVEARRRELARANEALLKGKDSNGESAEWDMFADDEKAKPTLATTTNQLIKVRGDGDYQSSLFAETQTHGRPSNGGTTSNARAGPSKPRPTVSTAGSSSSAPGGKGKDASSPPPLGRLAKRSRAFAQQAKKAATKGESIFSVRALVESRERLASGSLSPKPLANVHSIKSKPLGHSNGIPQSKMSAGMGFGKTGGTFKDQLNKSIKGEGMRKLCPDRDTRDRRSIDEIQKDIKARKKGAEPEPLPARVKPKPPPIPTTARPPPGTTPNRRQRSPSSSSTSSYELDRPRKRYRDEAQFSELSQAQVSAEIQALFRRPGMAQRKYVDDFSDDGSSDMEAGLSDVEEEERRTAAIARREDEIAEREERERKLAKERAKREKMRGN